MHSTGEYFSMYSCALKVGLFRLKDTAFAISRFGLSIKFWKPLLLHYVKYFYYSPFAVSKHFLEQKKEKDVYSYGQTPIKVMVELCDALDIQSSHVF